MEDALEIGLPSFRPTYMFLVRVLLEVIHEAIMIRLEQLENPIVEPSFLSIRQVCIILYYSISSKCLSPGHISTLYIFMSRVMKKHAFCKCKNKCGDQLRGSAPLFTQLG